MSHHPHQPPHLVDLTIPSPADDGIEDITPPIASHEAATMPSPQADSHLPAPTTPPHMRHVSWQPAEAGDNEDACPICLTCIDPHGVGPTSRFHWPHCRHNLHTGCAAHLVVQQPRPPCPTCRHPWDNTSDIEFTGQCQHHGVYDLPARLPTVDTQSRHRQPPPSPAHIHPECCPRLLLVNPSRPEEDTAWQELPDRQMAWAPVHHPPSNTWLPEWVCLRCSATVRPDPLLQHVPEQPHCPDHGGRTLHLNLPNHTRWWACSHPSATCSPTPLPTQPGSVQPTASTLPAPINWTHQGPPEGRHTVHPTHSWFYVPLLLAGTNRLQPEATAAWQQTPNTGQAWHRLVTQLQTAAPIPWQLLQHILTTLQGIATASGQRLAAAESNLPAALRAAGSTQPSGTLVHLPWAVELCQQPGGYIPATAQEALLQAFLGEQQASAAATLAHNGTLSQGIQALRNPPPIQPTESPPRGRQ